MLLQLAIDKPEHLALLPQMQGIVDIIEIGTPVLKRFGLSAITTARELCPETLILADSKTVDGGGLEADMIFGAGAAFMTVLSCASQATIDIVGARAHICGATVILDTITQSGQAQLLPSNLQLPDSYGYIAVHTPSDARQVGDMFHANIEAVRTLHSLGYRVALAGGIGPQIIDAVIDAAPEIVIVGGAITGAADAKEVAQWIKNKLPQQGRGWPWDERLITS